MYQILFLLLICLAVVCTIMLLVWVWATRIHNYGIVDVFWAFNFGIIAVLIFFIGTGNPSRILLVSVLLMLWSIRLGLYLSSRVFAHIHEEEGRYKQLRKEWQAHLHIKFFSFFQMQGISNALLSLPFFIIAANGNNYLSIWEWVGAGWWLLSIIGEGLADWQLMRFKRNKTNKGKVYDKGLWYYSRHPNYFFQLMIWIGVFIFAVSSPYGWLAAISPLSIAYLLFNITGIPMTEEQSLRSKGKVYQQYQKSTSAFIPWFKKTNNNAIV